MRKFKSAFKLIITSAYLFFITSVFPSTTFSQQSKVKATGHVTFIPVYRGGVRPSEEVMKACCSPRPLAGKTLYLKKSFYSSNFRIIRTDSSGDFSLKIIPGKYNLYLENKTSKPAKAPDCEEWLTRPQAEIIVKPSANKKFELVIREAFNPCEPMPQ